MGEPRGAPAPGSVRRVGVAVVALCLVQFMDVLGVTVVVTSLPAMLASLHAPESFGSLIATGYAMFFGGLLMLGARLGDRYGHRRTILASLVVFAVGALVAAIAPSVLALAAGRCLQGVAAAVSVPSALRLLTTLTEEGRARHRAIAAWSAAGAAAGASGFVVGGIVTDLTSWRVIFWAYLPLTAALAAVIAASVPRDGSRRQAESLNLAGSAIFIAAVMAFVVGATLITQADGRVAGGLLLAGCAALAGGFVLVDRRAAAPLLPPELIRSPRLRQGALASLLNTATTSSAITLVTLYLQNSLRRTPLQAAASLLPFSLAVIGGSALAAAVQRRAGPAPAGRPAPDRYRPGPDRGLGRRADPAGRAGVGGAAERRRGRSGHRAVVGRVHRPGHRRGAALAGWRVRDHQYGSAAGDRRGHRDAAPGGRGHQRDPGAAHAPAPGRLGGRRTGRGGGRGPVRRGPPGPGPSGRRGRGRR